MNKTLMQYVRDRKGNPRGVVIADSLDNNIRLGWSYANFRAGDKFNKKRGIEIASGRLETGTNQTVPNDVIPILENMAGRAKKYFKVLV